MKLYAVFVPTVSATLFLALLTLTLIAPLGVAQDAPQKTYEEILNSSSKAIASVKRWSAEIVFKGEMNEMSFFSNGGIMGSGNRLFAHLSFQVNDHFMFLKMVEGDDGVQWTEFLIPGSDGDEWSDPTEEVVKVARLDTNAIRKSYAVAPGEPEIGQELEQNPSKILEKLGAMYDLTADGNIEFHGTDTYWLYGPIKDKYRAQIERSAPMSASGRSAHSITIAVGVKDGFVRELEQWDADRNVLASLSFYDFKFNRSLDENLFDYTPPEIADVSDITEKYMKGN